MTARTVAAPASRTGPPARRPVRHDSRRPFDWVVYLFLLPAFAFYGAFVVVPVGNTVWISLFRWDGITVGTWAGLDNYGAVLRDAGIRNAIGNSLVFVFFYSLLPISIGLVLAAIVNRVPVRGLTMYRAMLFLPQILSMTVVAVAWRWIYAPDGVLNGMLRMLGLGWLTRSWLGDFTFALPAVGLAGTWVMFGFAMVLFIAGVQKISTELYESARTDGANAFQEFRHVTVPQLRGELAVALVFTITVALRNFDLVWLSTGGGPGTSTMVPSIFIFRRAFVSGQVGSAAAIGVLLTILIVSFTAVVLWLLRRRD